MPSKIEIYRDRQAIVARALTLVLEAYTQAANEYNRFTMAAAGGSTPRPLYESLAKQSLDWDKFHVFWGDERYVPASDPQSNEGMTRTAWLNLVDIPAQNIHAMPTDDNDPAIAAQKYAAHLQEFFGTNPSQFPAIDLVLLGIGPDGHTASLFPNTAALQVRDRLVTVGQKDGQSRITLTAPTINAAKQILFMVDGAAKADAVRAILAATGDANMYPARLIAGNVTWLLDEAAAALISR